MLKTVPADLLLPQTSAKPAGHPPAGHGKVGVLLLNLGTPDATDYWSMRRYLREFLSDRRVIETARALWWPLLNLIILQTRPQRKGRDYDTIWNRERDESPLKTITRAQTEKLAARLKGPGDGLGDGRILVDWAMRYGNPSVESRLAHLQKQGCERILAVPLYPQYAAATTATACDKLFEALMKMRWQPSLRVAPPYHDNPAYIGALAASMREALAGLDFEPEVVVCTFHGIPQAYFDKGDPYYCHCHKTWRLLREEMGWDEAKMPMTFQSRFGPDEWLKPYTDETVKALARSGVKRMAMVAPGFSADCLETTEELGVENAGYFRELGGEHFALIPCLNDSEAGMDVIEDIVRRELSGWV